MRNKILVVVLIGATAFSLVLFSFKIENKKPNAIETIKETYLENLRLFKVTIQELSLAINNWNKGEMQLHLVQDQFLICRSRFKKIEFLSAYLDEQYVLDFFNGAPLPKLQRHAPQLIVVEPKGLQIMDELLFGDKPEVAKDKLKENCLEMLRKIEVFEGFQQRINLTDRMVFEAVRYGLIRVFTMGLTGFDTPASGNALKDALAGMKVMGEAINQYKPFIENKDPNLAATISLKFQEAAKYLSVYNNFDDFDRLEFLMNFVDPLYANILDAQILLNIETPELVSSLKTPHNYKSKRLFSSDFLNSDYFDKQSYNGNEAVLVNLGRNLFFDPVLSSNNERSCASCHNPKLAFTDGVEKSTAFNMEGTVSRNAPTLVNTIFSHRFFWDMRSDRPDVQFEHVIFNEKEFNSSYKEIFEKLKQSREYVSMFKEAFPQYGADPVFRYTLTLALTAYLKSLVGFNSSFDQYIRGESSYLSEEVKNGFNIFMGKAACGTCHFAPVFNGTVPPFYSESESEVLGVPASNDTVHPVIDEDQGRYANKRTKEEADFFLRSFKTVTIRNIEITAPYMHNGAYKNLEEVVDFYNKGGGIGLGLEVPHQTLPDAALNLTNKEKEDLVAFMNALTDTTGLTAAPHKLPLFEGNTALNNRKIGGNY